MTPAAPGPLVADTEDVYRGITTEAWWVAEEGLPVVANGDFHEPRHLSGWKTLLPCEKDPDAVVDYLRSPRPAYLTRVEDDRALRLAA